jgi:hypothetical protein
MANKSRSELLSSLTNIVGQLTQQIIYAFYWSDPNAVV